jgi:HAD superfamily hydrolase (TIGR01490 family)
LALAIFDLDNTLLNGDSDYLWGCFLVQRGIVDAMTYQQENQRFYQQYLAGTLDIHEFLAFQLRPLTLFDMQALVRLRERFIEEKIRPIMLPSANALIEQHRARGDTLVIITATNRFITDPIAQAFGVEYLIATDPEVIAGRYTGRVVGTPCFREGKVKRLQEWLEAHRESLEDSWFYSDSHNDLPLLERVTHPVAVDSDPLLARHAAEKGWHTISLRGYPT